MDAVCINQCCVINPLYFRHWLVNKLDWESSGAKNKDMRTFRGGGGIVGSFPVGNNIFLIRIIEMVK